MIKVEPDQVVKHFTASDGVQLGCLVAGKGRPLLLVHGTAADHQRWNPVLPELQKRFTTYALDRRGRGASGDSSDWSFDREAEDIVTVIEGIGGPVDVVAHSMGAALSMEAATRTSAIRRLVLYEPALVGLPAAILDDILPRLRELLEAGDRDGLVQTFMLEVAKVPGKAPSLAHAGARARSRTGLSFRTGARWPDPRPDAPTAGRGQSGTCEGWR